MRWRQWQDKLCPRTDKTPSFPLVLVTGLIGFLVFMLLVGTVGRAGMLLLEQPPGEPKHILHLPWALLVLVSGMALWGFIWCRLTNYILTHFSR